MKTKELGDGYTLQLSRWSGAIAWDVSKDGAVVTSGTAGDEARAEEAALAALKEISGGVEPEPAAEPEPVAEKPKAKAKEKPVAATKKPAAKKK